MRYVTDLSGVKPEEIQHVSGDEVVAIYPRLGDHYPWFVVCKTSHGSHWGERYHADDKAFVYKPRKRRVLKPLHQILAENPYYVGTKGNIYFEELSVAICATEMHLFDGRAAISNWPESFYTEIIDDDDK